MELAGSEIEIVWQGRRVRSFVPTALAARELELDALTAARAAAATSEVVHAAEALDPDYEPLARLLLRSEGVASSFIEGVRAPIVDVVLAEERIGRQGIGAAAWVASNLAAVSEAVAGAATDANLSLATLCEWHRTLMTGSPTPERSVGVVRDEQGWIGGTSPLDAQLVTPPPGDLAALLDDLIAFVNRGDLDPVAQAAITHAQFETIHPFGDGNGRVGRVLTAWILTHRLAVVVPPPVSVAIAADVGGYGSGLTLFRFGDHLRWIRWFADAVANGGSAQRTLVEKVKRLRAQWLTQLGSAGARKPRRDAALYDALDLMPRHLVFTTPILERELGISRKAGGETLRRLADVGILTEYGTVPPAGAGQPAALYVARDLLGLAGSSPLR
ncbi:MAG TPA: Fic family protein [Acidimicrobiales bacterium]|jgi:Fic family protein